MAKRQTRKSTAPRSNEGNKYDKIFKENLQALLPAFIRKVLKIKILRMENLPEIRVQTTREAEPDFLKKVFTPEHPEGCILQIELEAKDEKNTDAKALNYIGAEYLKFGLPIDFRMIYLLKDKPKHIRGAVSFFGLKLTYPIYCLFEISYREFIYSDVPEEVVMSILADPEEKTGEEIIRIILERLVLLKGNSSALLKFINQLKVLSLLRKLHDETLKEIKDMVISEEFVKAIQRDHVFLLGEEKGEQSKAIVGIRNMTAKGFSVEVIAELLQVPESFVLDIQQQLKSEPQILEALRKPKASTASVAKKLGVSPLLVAVLKETFAKANKTFGPAAQG